MKTVLLVEDDQKITLALSLRLKSLGYKVATAADAVTAISQARQVKPDVLVLDVNLPGGDGFVVAERLLALVETSSAPIIFITASKKPGLMKRAQELGAVAFLEKPFDSEDLSAALSAAFPNEEAVPTSVA